MMAQSSLQLGTLFARILVDGLPLQHYGIELEGENKVTCWIPSEAGKRFSIFWEDVLQNRPNHESGRVRVDGIECGGVTLVSPVRDFLGANRAVEMHYFHTSATTGRPFMFSDLQHTDDDAYLRSAPGELGQIVLTIWPVIILSAGPLKLTEQPVQNQPVHERAKKSYSHCVTFGKEEALPLTQGVCTELISPVPLATFVFKYRSLARLIADGIAPPPPSPRPNKRPFSDMDGGHDSGSEDEAVRQVQALTERVRQLEAELKDRKRAAKRARTEATDEIVDLTA
ncbi:hypothetical protein BJ138DRAFT_1117475 [Hygrophoropsis aurantiaca]|uniref:Uncharacterized protein n=1 Tax=Hygrophoropsis aurantiaca TaxID=72124 RepID=A0ACB8A076_9AGAM|nr:hypothetical protein BJ138DRAFT_1117475 [Hygrophoropsis aurantiaca]